MKWEIFVIFASQGTGFIFGDVDQQYKPLGSSYDTYVECREAVDSVRDSVNGEVEILNRNLSVLRSAAREVLNRYSEYVAQRHNENSNSDPIAGVQVTLEEYFNTCKKAALGDTERYISPHTGVNAENSAVRIDIDFDEVCISLENINLLREKIPSLQTYIKDLEGYDRAYECIAVPDE